MWYLEPLKQDLHNNQRRRIILCLKLWYVLMLHFCAILFREYKWIHNTIFLTHALLFLHHILKFDLLYIGEESVQLRILYLLNTPLIQIYFFKEVKHHNDSLKNITILLLCLDWKVTKYIVTICFTTTLITHSKQLWIFVPSILTW